MLNTGQALRAESKLRGTQPGGRIAFFVIMAEHLSPEELRRFAEEDIGPDYLDAGPGYATLMASAGFEDVRMEDLTSEYEATTEAWIRERDAGS